MAKVHRMPVSIDLDYVLDDELSASPASNPVLVAASRELKSLEGASEFYLLLDEIARQFAPHHSLSMMAMVCHRLADTFSANALRYVDGYTVTQDAEGFYIVSRAEKKEAQ